MVPDLSQEIEINKEWAFTKVCFAQLFYFDVLYLKLLRAPMLMGHPILVYVTTKFSVVFNYSYYMLM